MIYKRAKLIEIVTADKLKLPGILFEPRKRTKRVLVYLHGKGTSSIFYSLNRIYYQARTLNRAGVSYFAFNNRGAYQYHKIYSKTGKKDKVLAGTAFELIKDCIKDIDAAMAFLQKQGYKEFYLIGFSTGANKICVYNYYKPQNKVSKYILVGGADDLGLFYIGLGKKKFDILLDLARQKIKQGKGKELVPRNLIDAVYSYQSIYDTINPDGDYNVFPYNEYFNHLKQSKKKLFRYFKSIKTPTLVVYGDKDEYAYGRVQEILEVLKRTTSAPEKFKFVSIKNADHGFTNKDKVLCRAIVEWL
ncbi:MAG: DUF1749 domain-containing protein [bacterium]|nr:DUF1749 domain-containing protein [bacterium]